MISSKTNCTPKSPKVAPMIVKAKRSSRKEVLKAKEGIEKPAMAVIATIMTTPGETRPAEMAASPRISAPTMLMAGPIAGGRRSPASRRISKISSRSSISATTGKGTPSRVLMMRRKSDVGSSSG